MSRPNLESQSAALWLSLVGLLSFLDCVLEADLKIFVVRGDTMALKECAGRVLPTPQGLGSLPLSVPALLWDEGYQQKP